MRPGLGRRAGAAGALVLAVLLGTPASPAGAEATFTDIKPAANATLDTASATISGTANVSDTLLDTLTVVKQVTLTLDGKSMPAKACGTKQCPFTFTSSFPLNGPHTATIAALESSPLGNGATTTVDRKFAIAAPAARPVLDTPKVADGRTVDLAWSRNTEGDMLYYAVFRKDPGATKYFQVGAKVNQPTSGTKVTFTDTTTATFGGGDYSYQVVAVRKGATGTAESEKLSEPSTATAVSVPLPPTTTTGATVPGTPAAGPTTTVKPGPPAGVDLSGFIASRPPAVTLPTITIPEPPDTGFTGTLPFGARPAGDDIEDGEAEAVPPRDTASTSIIGLDAGRPLVPVAGGLVLLLLAMHMRLLARRVKAPASADLPVVAAPVKASPKASPKASAKAPASARHVPEPDPRSEFFDMAAEADWASGQDEAAGKDKAAERPAAPWEDWAAPTPHAEPAPEPVALWAPAPSEGAPGAPPLNADDIEVVDVVSSTRRPLVRTGSR